MKITPRTHQILLLPLLFLGGAQSAVAKDFVSIGTGSNTGVYYSVGNAICKLINEQVSNKEMRCSTRTSEGSINNILQMQDGELEFAIVQSDTQHNAFNGEGAFSEKGPYKQLRSLFSLQDEAFNIVTTADSGIKSVADLAGKRISIGKLGSGDQSTFSTLMKYFRWHKNTFESISYYQGGERTYALCTQKIQAYVYVASAPNEEIKESVIACDAKLVPAQGKIINQLVAQNPDYIFTNTPIGTYKTNSQNVPSFGVVATFVTTADVSEKTAYTLTKVVFDNLAQLKLAHPALAHLNKHDMANNALSAPLHPGAKTYFIQTDLLPKQ